MNEKFSYFDSDIFKKCTAIKKIYEHFSVAGFIIEKLIMWIFIRHTRIKKWERMNFILVLERAEWTLKLKMIAMLRAAFWVIENYLFNIYYNLKWTWFWYILTFIGICGLMRYFGTILWRFSSLFSLVGKFLWTYVWKILLNLGKVMREWIEKKVQFYGKYL